MKSVTCCHSQPGDRIWPECSLTNRFRSCLLASRLCRGLGGFGSFSRRQLNTFYLIPVRSLHSDNCEMRDFSKISQAVIAWEQAVKSGAEGDHTVTEALDFSQELLCTHCCLLQLQFTSGEVHFALFFQLYFNY